VIPNPWRVPLADMLHPALLDQLAEDGPVHVTSAVMVVTCVSEDGEPFLAAIWDEDVASWSVMGMLDMELTTARARCVEVDSGDDEDDL
jgi:hypothetical protein